MRRDDLRNVKLHDVDLILEKIISIKNDDPLFYYSYVVDDDDMVLYLMIIFHSSYLFLFC